MAGNIDVDLLTRSGQRSTVNLGKYGDIPDLATSNFSIREKNTFPCNKRRRRKYNFKRKISFCGKFSKQGIFCGE